MYVDAKLKSARRHAQTHSIHSHTNTHTHNHIHVVYGWASWADNCRHSFEEACRMISPSYPMLVITSLYLTLINFDIWNLVHRRNVCIRWTKWRYCRDTRLAFGADAAILFMCSIAHFTHKHIAVELRRFGEQEILEYFWPTDSNAYTAYQW